MHNVFNANVKRASISAGVKTASFDYGNALLRGFFFIYQQQKNKPGASVFFGCWPLLAGKAALVLAAAGDGGITLKLGVCGGSIVVLSLRDERTLLSLSRSELLRGVAFGDPRGVPVGVPVLRPGVVIVLAAAADSAAKTAAEGVPGVGGGLKVVESETDPPGVCINTH